MVLAISGAYGGWNEGWKRNPIAWYGSSATINAMRMEKTGSNQLEHVHPSAQSYAAVNSTYEKVSITWYGIHHGTRSVGYGEPWVWGISAVWGMELPRGKPHSVIGKAPCGKRNELVCCSRADGLPAEDLHTIPYGGPSHDLMRASQKNMREMMCCAGPSARVLMLLVLSFGAITSSVALIPLNGQAFVAPRAGPGLVLVGSFVDDYLFFMSDSLTGLEVPEDGYPVTDMLYNVNKCEVSSDMCLTSVGCFK